ncbi:flagella synthesis protein FlgN [Thiomonas sp.]|jgi:flagella synthesis protein FlgN|uniref:flagella synthesis protein FlgN n=1 Tax=Thiomonas sp. TaxID=2047785 RepID=UPI0026247F4B|nr:flagellar protein FlgN [Thiomonas sp.]
MSTPLSVLLDAQLHKLQALDRLLATEHDCLLHAAAERLDALAAEKTALFAELDAIERQRQAAFAQDALAAQAPLWPQVRQLARQVATANQRNGAMIQALLRHVEGGLHILRGTSEADTLYGAQGQRTAAAPRRLVRA